MTMTMMCWDARRVVSLVMGFMMLMQALVSRKEPPWLICLRVEVVSDDGFILTFLMIISILSTLRFVAFFFALPLRVNQSINRIDNNNIWQLPKDWKARLQPWRRNLRRRLQGTRSRDWRNCRTQTHTSRGRGRGHPLHGFTWNLLTPRT